ncbi:hypothetical protein Tco_0970260 [Tanacetum coccineum]
MPILTGVSPQFDVSVFLKPTVSSEAAVSKGSIRVAMASGGEVELMCVGGSRQALKVISSAFKSLRVARAY